MTRQATVKDGAKSSGPPSARLAKWIPWAIRSLPLMALAVIPFCILSLSTSLSDLRTYPGLDLRSKVVGARAVAASLDPYDQDAAGRQSDYFKSVKTPLYSPALLILYIPLSGLAFETQRSIYFWLDWVFAAGALYLLIRFLSLDRQRMYLCWIAYASFVLCSYAFRIHLERGQYYVLLLLLTCYVAASLKNNWTSWMSCLPAALLMVLRPTYGLILIFAVICMGSKKWVFRIFTLTAALFLVTLPLVGLHGWTEFAHVAALRGAEHIADIMTTACGRSLPAIASNGTGNGPFVFEHIDFSNSLPHPAINGTFIGLVYWVSDNINKAHRLPATACGLAKWASTVNSLFALVVLAGGTWVAWLARKRTVSRNVLIAGAMLWPMLFEIFGPERYLYTAVLEVLPLLLLATDRSVFQGVSAGASGFYWLVAFLALALAPSVLFQIGDLGFVKQSLDSAIILLMLPAAMAVVIVHSVLTSGKPNLVDRQLGEHS